MSFLRGFWGAIVYHYKMWKLSRENYRNRNKLKLR